MRDTQSFAPEGSALQWPEHNTRKRVSEGRNRPRRTPMPPISGLTSYSSEHSSVRSGLFRSWEIVTIPERQIEAIGMYQMDWRCLIGNDSFALAYSKNNRWRECTTMHASMRTRKMSETIMTNVAQLMPIAVWILW